MGKTVAYPDHVREAAVAQYGRRSMSLVAADLGVSTGAVSHWWAKAKRSGAIQPLFGRFDGGRVRAGRVSRHTTTLDIRVEPAVARRYQRRQGAPRAPGGEGRS